MEQTTSLGTETGSWPVCDGYALQSSPEEVVREKEDGGLGSYRIVPEYSSSEEGKWKWYFPLREVPDLFLEFARLPHEERSPQTALAWYRKYGSLEIDGTVGVEPDQPPSESVRMFFREVEQAAEILSLCEIVADEDEEAAERLIRKKFSQASEDLDSRFYFDEAWDQEARLELVQAYALRRIREKFLPSGLPYLHIRLGFQGPPWVLARQHFHNLLEAMYVQVYEAMAEGGGIVHCTYCSQSTFLAPPLPGSKNGHWGKKFCSNQCRQRHHYYTKTKPKRHGQQQRKL